MNTLLEGDTSFDTGGGGSTVLDAQPATTGNTTESFIPNGSVGDILEKQLAEDLGLSRDVLYHQRKEHLTEDVHWKKSTGGILLTQEGQHRIISLLRVEHVAHEKQTGTAKDLVVVRLVRNPRVVLVSDGRRDDIVVVVRSSENLRRGMILRKCTPQAKKNGSFIFSGRLPRSPGRW